MFHGDNLDFMRAMDSGTVDLIATDPPFNKNKDFHATPDSLAALASFQDRWLWEPVHDEWLGQIKDDNLKLTEAVISARKAHSESMGAFICFLSVRMMSMHRLLKPTGSLFLHCDPTASHYIKAALDAIFGAENFVNEIIWRRAFAKGNAVSQFGRNSDCILWFSKSKDYVYTPEYREHDAKYLKPYNKVEEGTGRRYRLAALNAPAGSRGQRYEFLGVVRNWRWNKARMEESYEKGLVVQTKPGAVPQQKLYLDEQKGPMIDNIWDDIKRIEGNSAEKTGYPTQKPLALYKRIIKAASNPGDVVFDPFAGCATTCVAAELLGRQWVGIDIWDKVADVVKDRVEREQIPLLKEEILLINELPKRTDSGETAAPYLRVRVTIKEPKDEYRTREAKVDHLIKQFGLVCQGCGREFDDKAYLQLDHMLPRADGGPNHISNRCLLCPPCNIRKSNKLTLSGLRAENKKIGFMHSEERLAILR